MLINSLIKSNKFRFLIIIITLRQGHVWVDRLNISDSQFGKSLLEYSKTHEMYWPCRILNTTKIWATTTLKF